MAARQPVDRTVGRTRIQPTASPVDTFSRTSAGSGLNELAQSLQEVAPAVAKYSDVLAAQQSETQKEAGAQKARQMFESGVTYKDAIKKGLISPSESPWFQAGAKEQFGRVTAGRFSTDLQDAIAKDPALQETTDVAQYDKFVADFRKQWTADNIGTENRGLNFEHGFGSMVDGYTENSRRQFVAQAGARLVTQVGDNHYGEVFQTSGHELDMNTSHSAISDDINLTNERFTSMGGDETVANHAVAQAITDLALSRGDASVLDILNGVKAGKQTLDARPWAQELIQKTRNTIWEQKQAHHRADSEAQAESDKAYVTKTLGDAVSVLATSSNPSRVDLRTTIDALSKVNPEAGVELKRMQNVFTEGAFASDVNAKQSALASIFKPAGDPGRVDVHTLVGMLNARQINASDFITLKSQIDERDTAEEKGKNGSGKSPYNDPQFAHSMTSLGQQIQAGKADEMYSPEVVRRLNGAQAEFGQAWLEYSAGAGKNATYLDKNDFLEKTLLAVTKKWQPELTKRDAAQPSVPQIDLRTPQQKERVRSMANLIDSQSRAGTGFSPGVLNFLRSNNVTDVSAFIKKYADHD